MLRCGSAQHDKERHCLSTKPVPSPCHAERQRSIRPLALSRHRTLNWKQRTMNTPTRLVILGSTGSIGTQTLEVVAAQPDRWQVVGLAARGGRLDLLNEQIRRFRPLVVAVEDDTGA